MAGEISLRLTTGFAVVFHLGSGRERAGAPARQQGCLALLVGAPARQS
jgi:hypothetical protein